MMFGPARTIGRSSRPTRSAATGRDSLLGAKSIGTCRTTPTSIYKRRGASDSTSHSRGAAALVPNATISRPRSALAAAPGRERVRDLAAHRRRLSDLAATGGGILRHRRRVRRAGPPHGMRRSRDSGCCSCCWPACATCAPTGVRSRDRSRRSHCSSCWSCRSAGCCRGRSANGRVCIRSIIRILAGAHRVDRRVRPPRRSWWPPCSPGASRWAPCRASSGPSWACSSPCRSRCPAQASCFSCRCSSTACSP